MATDAVNTKLLQEVLSMLAGIKLTTVERAVISGLMSLPGYTLEQRAWLCGKGDRYGRRDMPAFCPMPYGESGINKAVSALIARGWIKSKSSHWRYERNPCIWLDANAIRKEHEKATKAA